MAGRDTSLVGGSPVTSLEGGDEAHNELEVDSAETHPHVVDVPSEYPGGGDKT